MNKTALAGMWDQMRQKYGIYLRLLEAIPEDRLHAHPVPGMRTPAELAVHTSGTVVRDNAQGVAKGAITANESSEGSVADRLRTRADLIAYARQCWKDADAAVARIGDAQLSAIVPTPWNMSFPGYVGFFLMNDEFVHHRGQLYAFARACGVAPPFLYSFEQNDPEFAPAAQPAAS